MPQNYVVEDEDDYKMVYDRGDFSPWKIEVMNMEDEEKYVGVFRTAPRDGMLCEQFTLLPAKYSDTTLIQVRIYKNGDVLFYTFIPANVYVHKRKKIVTITLLADITFTKGGAYTIELNEE